jgi:hypothetical protein
VCESAWHYDAVFTGRVTGIAEPRPADAAAVQPMSFPRKQVKFAISEVLSGLEPSLQEITIETGLGGGDCGYGFRTGLEYIVYASRTPGGSLLTGICSPTRRAEEASEDLAYFRRMRNAPPVSEIRVTAYDPERSWRNGTGNGRALARLPGARVTIEGAGVRRTAVTDQAGRSVFRELPPGEYKVDVMLDGYVTTHQLPVVTVRARGCAEVPLPLQPEPPQP